MLLLAYLQTTALHLDKLVYVLQCDVETATGVYSCLSVDMMFKRQVSSVKLSEAQCSSVTRTMEPGGGAFGGAKAGAAAQDPMAFLRKPSVVFRIGALVGGYTGYNSGSILTSMSRLLGLSTLR